MSQELILREAERVGQQLAERLVAIQRSEVWADVAAAMDEALSQLSALECWGEANAIPSSVLWRAAGELLKTGSLQAHARFKPHGYAGDYEMLERLIQRDVRGDGLPLAFDTYFQNHPAVQAVRNRTQWVADWIVANLRQRSGAVRVVSIGSGPAADLRAAAAELSPQERQRLRLTLLDLDQRALDFAEPRLASLLGDSHVDARRENLFRLPRRGRRPDEESDLIVCTGLFDYLSDPDAVGMLQWMDAQLAADGELVMMNFCPRNGSRAYMEWVGAWRLLHRTEDDMAQLAERAGFGRNWELTEEAERIDLILRRRPSQAVGVQG